MPSLESPQMKYISIIILTFFISCKDAKNDAINEPAVNENPITRDNVDLESRISEISTAIINSTPTERKSHLMEFLNYADRVDGAAAEAYANFAFEYVEENPEKFFSALTVNDSMAIQNWADNSAAEVMLIGDNTNGIDSVLIDININHSAFRKKLTPAEQKLDANYLKRLEQAANK